MDLVIREMLESDVTEAFLETLAGLSAVNLTVAQGREVFREIHLAPGRRTCVALVNDVVVGTATLLIEKKFIHQGGLVGHIEDVVVHQTMRHRGIGTAMVKHLTEVARAAGCYKAILNCFPQLVPFYARLGYHQWEEGLRIDLSPGRPAASP